MKILITTLSALCISITCIAQVTFTSESYASALKRAKETGRMLFIQFESANCEQCNEVGNKAFEDKMLGDRLAQGFISLKIDSKHPDRLQISNLFGIDRGFGSLFINAEGVLIHKFLRTSTMALMYSKEIDIALIKAGEGLKISDFEKEYKSGNKSLLIIEQLLILKRSLNIPTDSLLEEYVKLLPADSLASVHTIAFIAGMDPVVDGIAFNAIRKNNHSFNQAWNTLNLPVRVGINRRTISKSMQKAIEENNISYANKVASFAASTYSTANEGRRTYNFQMVNFYKGIKDTVRYITHAIDFYDTYYMTVNPDSIRYKDSIQNIINFSQRPVQSSVVDGNKTKEIKSFVAWPMSQSHSTTLTEVALSFYRFTSNPVYLQKALSWSARANEIYPTPESMDVYARLLYQAGKKEDALLWIFKAINMKKEKGFNADGLERLAAEMREGKALTAHFSKE